MYLIVGLGNPTEKYEKTRHNIGFDVIDVLAEKYDIKTDRKRCRALCGRGAFDGESVLLAKPQTFMNLSGESVSRLVRFFKIDPEKDLAVVYDDISLPPGSIRIRKQGSAGGHNGMKSIISCLGTDRFSRVRVGVGDKPQGGDLVNYVLGHFPAGERKLVDQAIDDAAKALALMAVRRTDEAMNMYNRKKQIH